MLMIVNVSRIISKLYISAIEDHMIIRQIWFRMVRILLYDSVDKNIGKKLLLLEYENIDVAW